MCTKSLRHAFAGLAGLLVFGLAASPAGAHCQVPCGIYDDEARIEGIREDITTIEKATRKIQELLPSGSRNASAQDYNQAVRWVVTKEDHASDVITTVAEYFLTQKVKPPENDGRDAQRHYHQLLADHHAVMRAAMKTKQTASDMSAVEELKSAVDALAHHYTSEKPAQTRPSRRGRY